MANGEETQHSATATEENEEAQPKLDLYLSEENLILLAMRELRGARPPTRFPNSSQPNWEALESHPDTLVKKESKTSLNPNEAFQKRTVLAHEITQRGWTERDLAKEGGFSASEAMALVRGYQRVTPEIAQKLAKIFATSPDFWLNS